MHSYKTIEISKLPSGGKAYPSDVTISYRRYTFEEVKKSSFEDLPYLQKLELGLKGVEVTGMEKTLLTASDYLYILLLRRLSTLASDKFQIPYDNGDEVGYHVFSLSDLKFFDMKAPMLPCRTKAFSFYKGEVVEFKPLTVQGLMTALQKKKQKDASFLYSLMCISHPQHEFYERISKSTDANDVVLMDKIDMALHHELKPLRFTVEVTDEDGNTRMEEKEIGLAGGQALISPFRESEDTIEDELYFGEEPTPTA